MRPRFPSTSIFKHWQEGCALRRSAQARVRGSGLGCRSLDLPLGILLTHRPVQSSLLRWDTPVSSGRSMEGTVVRKPSTAKTGRLDLTDREMRSVLRRDGRWTNSELAA